MKILVIQTAFLGDVVLATSLLETLHKSDPNCHIDFLVRKGNESALLHHPFIQRLLIFDKSNKWRSLFQLLKQIRNEKYTHVINIHRFLSSGLIAGLSGAPHRIGFLKNPMAFLYTQAINHQIETQSGEHEIDRNYKLIESLVNVPVEKPKLYPSAEAYNKIKPSKDYICVAPATVWFTKQWPADNWVALIQQLSFRFHIYLLGGKTDTSYCEEIMIRSGDINIENLAGQLSVLESAALIANAKMTFANDSAPLHIASAMNAPVTAIFCSTLPQFGFTPLSTISFIFETNETLDCRPCGIHGLAACPKGHFKCSNIEPEQVAATIDK